MKSVALRVQKNQMISPHNWQRIVTELWEDISALGLLDLYQINSSSFPLQEKKTSKEKGCSCSKPQMRNIGFKIGISWVTHSTGPGLILYHNTCIQWDK